MIERLTIRNFKRFDEVTLELGQRVLLVGPNNSGKTTALQALALWQIGLQRWAERAQNGGRARGVTINRVDFVNLPVPETHLFWRDRQTRRGRRSTEAKGTEPIRIEVLVEGTTDGDRWRYGLEFDFATGETVYCRPIGLLARDEKSFPIPPRALGVRIAYLPPMSGLIAREVRLDQGAINVRVGEGRTAEVLRNLCWNLASQRPEAWASVQELVERLFGVRLATPTYLDARGEISMEYREGRATLDLTSAGRGLQQTLLLLAYMHAHPGSVLLFDEPDAHLEILRQRQIYNTLTEGAERAGSQLLIASHSEVLLNEAADRDVVLSFVRGRPKRIDDRGELSQVAKALKSIGWEAYQQAEQAGWVLYLEGATDLAILRAWAELLGHPAAEALHRPFVEYVGNRPPRAYDHFFGVRAAVDTLVGLVLLDSDADFKEEKPDLPCLAWRRREIENYLAFPEVLLAWVDAQQAAPDGTMSLFSGVWRQTMEACIEERVPPAALRDRDDPWWRTVKATDDFLDLVFDAFFERLELANWMRKTDYHTLAPLVPEALIDPEVEEKLDAIVAVARSARPLSDEG
ncbi:MAG: AAA family ATPase [Acidobacteriota bacterium]